MFMHVWALILSYTHLYTHTLIHHTHRIELPTFDYTFTPHFIGILLGNCVLAFALNLAVVLFVTNIGIVGMTLAGILKDVLVVFLGVRVCTYA